MELKFWKVVFTQFLVLCAKNRHWNVNESSKHNHEWPFCIQQSVSMMSWRRPACIAKISYTAGAGIFLLFIGKHKHGFVLRGSELKRKKYFSCVNIVRTTKWRLKVEVFAPFPRFQFCTVTTLHLCFKLLSIWGSTVISSPVASSDHGFHPLSTWLLASLVQCPVSLKVNKYWSQLFASTVKQATAITWTRGPQLSALSSGQIGQFESSLLRHRLCKWFSTLNGYVHSVNSLPFKKKKKVLRTRNWEQNQQGGTSFERWSCAHTKKKKLLF